MDDELLDLEDRLRELGRVPVDPAVRDRHLAAFAAVGADTATAAGPRRWRFGWKAVAAAGVAGFLAGSTGLAAAGSLPGPAQDVAHDVLGAVGVNVPRSTEGCPEGRQYRNHGQYVSEVEAAGGDVEAASHSPCGKPLHSGGGNGNGNGGANGREPGVPRPDTDGDPCTGPPPWAGAHLPRDQRLALQEERRVLCGDEVDHEDEVEEPEVEEPEVEAPEAEEPEVEEPEATATTVVVEDSTTTTTAAPEETTSTTVG